MRKYQTGIVRVGLLYAGAATLLAGHELLSRQLFTQMRGLPAAVGLASVSASLIVWLVGGVFVLPLLRQALRTGPASGAPVVIGTALCVVAARAGVEAATGVTLVGVPLFTLAGAIVLVGGRSLFTVRAVGSSQALRPVVGPAVRLAGPRTWTRAS